MTAFSAIAPEYGLLLIGLLFLAAMSELALCLYVFVSVEKRRRCADGAILFLLLLALLAVFAAFGRTGAPAIRTDLPWIMVPAGAALIFLHAGLRLLQERKRRRNHLSPSSVREALDDLNAGVLFADGNGESVLVNHTMKRLADTLIGRYPRMRKELEAALRNPPAGVEKTEGAPVLYRFPDGRIWQFDTVPLRDPALAGFTQTTARELTALYGINEALEKENAALKESNAELQKLYLHVGERVKEQELLDMKIRIHDEIGAGLIALSEMMTRGSETDLETQIKKLYYAVRVLGTPPAPKRETLEAVRAQAKEMNVALRISGEPPWDPAAERWIALAAGECVTNCVKHAKGSEVRITFSRTGDLCRAVFTNDGEKPAGPVQEGVGLSALRRTVENGGAAMRIESAPVFALILEWKKTEEKGDGKE